MKNLSYLFVIFIAGLLFSCTSQTKKKEMNYRQIISGEDFEQGLKIAYNPANKIITGFFENYYGYDDAGNPNHRYSCLFYLRGLYKDTISDIEVYSPLEGDINSISGKIKITDSLHCSILLSKEPDCFNVGIFSQFWITFNISRKTNWLEIRYIDTPKSYLYKTNDESTIRKAYLVKGDVVFIDKIENDWIHCTYFGKSMTEGWLKKETINNF